MPELDHDDITAARTPFFSAGKHMRVDDAFETAAPTAASPDDAPRSSRSQCATSSRQRDNARIFEASFHICGVACRAHRRHCWSNTAFDPHT
jgi:hypothetical protein